MRARNLEQLLTAFLLLLPATATSPAVSVDLKASWNAAPYLLELLETAAAEDEACYFPLLDRVAAGALPNDLSDQQLYHEFLRLANADGFLTKPEERSSFDLALSIRAAAPRIEAHFHHYTHNVVPSMGKLYNRDCPAWVDWSGSDALPWTARQHCMLDDDFRQALKGGNDQPAKLPFDHVYEQEEEMPVVALYADIQSSEFQRLHTRLKGYAEEGLMEYLVRYRPVYDAEGKGTERPVTLSGYGVELVLKKTDYMVIDDRDAEDGKDSEMEVKSSAQLESEESQDIKPLQGKELAGLGYKAASYIMGSDKPFDTLLSLLQDFPKHSAAIAAVEPNEDVTSELRTNWDLHLGPGRNLIWINGYQMSDHQINAFALLEHLRRERKIIGGLTSLGLNGSEAVRMVTHNMIAESSQEERPQRFDYRDDTEGGHVIIWLNNLEKDNRYKEWSSSITTLLRRVFPGQIHPIRRNLHNLIIPLDFSDKSDMTLLYEQLRLYIDRKIAMRFGIVPITKTKESSAQAKAIYYIIDTYGLQTAFSYIEQSLKQGRWSSPVEDIFNSIAKVGTPKEGSTLHALAVLLKDTTIDERVRNAERWGARLGANGPKPMIFINGQGVAKDEEWMEAMMPKLRNDITHVQRGAYDGIVNDHTDLVEYLLDGAAMRRNPHIFPETENSIKQANIMDILRKSKAVFDNLPKITSDKFTEASIWLVGDFDQPSGARLLRSAAELQKDNPKVSLVLVNNPESLNEKGRWATLFLHLQQIGALNPETLKEVLEEIPQNIAELPTGFPNAEELFHEGIQRMAKGEAWSIPDHLDAKKFWQHSRGLVKMLGFTPGQKGIVINGRVVGPIPDNEDFETADFMQLLEVEKSLRINPVLDAAKDLGVLEKLKGPIGLVALTNQVALSQISSAPPSIFDDSDLSRIDIRSKIALTNDYTTITVGDKDSATIHILASVDPASEKAQKWVPLLKTLSEMNGVHLEIFLNPAKSISELPVKRFYQQVLNGSPVFDAAGQLIGPRARFENIPEKPLLSFSMDVPPSWLVTPKESVYDLDNIKLESLKDRLQGADVEATYELRNILIEGHSQDVSTGGAPRGVQLVLGTTKESCYQDTIIMSNLGYFQFKANPGVWNMELKDGRSKEVFKIDTIGTNGMRGGPNSRDSRVVLMSFQGATLFPKLSRNPGMENEDVLEPVSEGTGAGAMDKAKKWFKKAETFLGKGEVVSKPQAEINIFSVASGHLYERFLNIMMLSVMKHTDKTVKFWFIENFLSPSFKDFIPIMAKEYNFNYELVTYKWPHWLRAQKEKQREIWGYKILFLDVLFPLDLDKVIFVDADQIVRTDLKELVDLDLGGAPYGFTPMCDSRTEIEGFRFWKQGYWKTYLQGLPYHISALYVVDLQRFRQIAAGDRLRGTYHQLSADPDSLANLDQDLPNHMQTMLPIHSLPQEWLWCETWCSDGSLKDAKTIDLCNNPMTKEPKLDRARRQVPEWTEYDEEVAALARRVKGGHLEEAGKGVEKEKEKQVVMENRPEEAKEAKRVKDEL